MAEKRPECGYVWRTPDLETSQGSHVCVNDIGHDGVHECYGQYCTATTPQLQETM